MFPNNSGGSGNFQQPQFRQVNPQNGNNGQQPQSRPGAPSFAPTFTPSPMPTFQSPAPMSNVPSTSTSNIPAMAPMSKPGFNPPPTFTPQPIQPLQPQNQHQSFNPPSIGAVQSQMNNLSMGPPVANTPSNQSTLSSPMPTFKPIQPIPAFKPISTPNQPQPTFNPPSNLSGGPAPLSGPSNPIPAFKPAPLAAPLSTPLSNPPMSGPPMSGMPTFKAAPVPSFSAPPPFNPNPNTNPNVPSFNAPSAPNAFNNPSPTPSSTPSTASVGSMAAPLQSSLQHVPLQHTPLSVPPQPQHQSQHQHQLNPSGMNNPNNPNMPSNPNMAPMPNNMPHMNGPPMPNNMPNNNMGSGMNMGPPMPNMPNMSNPNMTQPGQPGQPGQLRPNQGPGPNQSGQVHPLSPTPFSSSRDSSPLVPPHVELSNPRLLCASTSVFPATSALYQRAHLPVGLVFRPLADLPDTEAPVSVVNFNNSGVLRCLKCRAYLSAYAKFQDNGQHWVCNFCHSLNAVPDRYYCALDSNGYRTDVAARPELTQSCYEVVATSEYMVRPPMPPTYVFLLDVSHRAVQSGLLQTACDAIRASLDSLPGGSSEDGEADGAHRRTRICFVTFNGGVQTYEFRPDASTPHMHCQGDVNELVVPAPSGLHCNLHECRSQIEDFLDALPHMHAENTDPEVALGPALTLAMEIIESIGGKFSVFLSGLPTSGKGRLANRESALLNRDGTLRPGTSPDVLVVKDPAGDKYFETLALAMTKMQVSVDLYLAPPSGFIDVATLHDLPRLTGGDTSYYPDFSTPTHTARLCKDVSRSLSRLTGWESVVRLRVSQGATVADVLGNFSLRGNSLIVLPTIDADKTFVFELRPDDTAINQRAVYVQGALLYTTLTGERRIRVHTMCMPITHNLVELFDSCSVNALANTIAKQTVAVAVGPGGGLSKARSHALTRGLNIIRAYKSVMTEPANFGVIGALPIMCLGLAKCLGLREGSDVRADVRASTLYTILTMGLVELETLVRPRLLPLHTLDLPASVDAGVGLKSPTASVNLPSELSLSASQLASNGLYLLDNGVEMFMYVGGQLDPAISHALFNPASEQASGLVLKPHLASQGGLGEKVWNIIDSLQKASPYHQDLHIIREGMSAPVSLMSMFIEDAHLSTLSLAQFVAVLNKNG